MKGYTNNEICIEKKHDGSLELSVITDDGEYFKERYYYYPKREAITLFNQQCKAQKMEN